MPIDDIHSAVSAIIDVARNVVVILTFLVIIAIPASSDSYVLVLNNRYSNAMKKVSVALTHTWKQEISTHDQG